MGRGRRRLSAWLLLLAGCTSAPSPTHVTLPPIPLEAFFANRDTSYDHKVSPDGTRLAWIGMADGRLTVLVKRLGGDDIVTLDTHSRRSIQSFVWAQDSRRILYGQDRDGDENTHVFVADTDRPRERPRDLTPFAGQRAFVQQVIRSDAEHIVVGVNRPRTALADLYRTALTTGEQTRLADNAGDVLTWITDDDGVVRARIRRQAPGARVLERVGSDAARWEPLFTLDGEEYARAVGFTADRAGLWLLTNHRRDRYALIRLDLATGAAAGVAHEHGVVDVETAGVSRLTGQPLFAITYPGYPETRVFDATLEADLAPLGEPGPAEVRILSLDDAERFATVRVARDRGGEHHLLDRRTRTRTLLSRSAMAAYADRLARVEPISLTSRDGLTLHGYLTRPPGASARVPMVLLVHGGPWTRDYWGYNPTVQFLASRGWAVLQINYRASTGYGRAFVEAGVRQHARAIHADLLDGVRWAVEQGIAHPARVAIMGGSYGGYATLVGLTFTPEVFACGVDLFGMSNLVTQLEGRPSYWTWSFFEPYYRKYYGDVSRPEDRQRLEAQSPLFRAAEVRRPVLVIHGANDPNVKQQESDQMVSALRAAGKDVQYVVLAGEGHGAFGDPTNALRMYGAIEQFLSACLGR